MDLFEKVVMWNGREIRGCVEEKKRNLGKYWKWVFFFLFAQSKRNLLTACQLTKWTLPLSCVPFPFRNLMLLFAFLYLFTVTDLQTLHLIIKNLQKSSLKIKKKNYKYMCKEQERIQKSIIILLRQL